jgi:predicted nucleic-acid-binding protein
MIALDTNLLVRLATADEPEDAALVNELMATQRCYVPVTVMLEAEWVLRSRYGYSAEDFAAFAGFVCQHANVHMREASEVRQAVELHRQGLDFADALHASLAEGAPLVTLDRTLIKRGRNLGLELLALGERPHGEAE